MNSVDKMNNMELRIALAVAGKNGWENVRHSAVGELIADVPGGITELPVEVPDWPVDVKAAMRLEDGIASMGLAEEYIKNLALVTGADIASATGVYRIAHASARKRSEAALATLRATE
jgi:hypothetical protein